MGTGDHEDTEETDENDSEISALRVFCQSGKSNYVHYVVNRPYFNRSLVFCVDDHGRNILYYAANKVIAQLIINAINIEKVQELLSSSDNDQQSVLHVAAAEGRCDVVQYLVDISLTKDELLLRKGMYGQTALHVVSGAETANALLQSIQPAIRDELLESKDVFIQTVFHKASRHGKVDVIEYLLDHCQDELVVSTDKWGRSALHYAANEEVAELFINHVCPPLWQSFVLHQDCCRQSILHRAVIAEKSDVVDYICLHVSYKELITQKDDYGRTALHYATTSDIAAILITSLPMSKRMKFMMSQDIFKKSSLHSAAEQGRIDVIKYLLIESLETTCAADCDCCPCRTRYGKQRRSDVGKHIIILVSSEADSGTNSAAQALASIRENDCYQVGPVLWLHVNDNEHVSVVQQFDDLNRAVYKIIAIEEEQPGLLDMLQSRVKLLYVRKHQIQDGFVFDINVCVENCSEEGPITTVEDLSDQRNVEPVITPIQCLISLKDHRGRTALHNSINHDVAECILQSADEKLGFLLRKDNEGHTVVAVAVQQGRPDVLAGHLEYVRTHWLSFATKLVLTEPNKYGQNIFHLSAISPLAIEFYTLLESYIDMAGNQSLVIHDIYNNTPLHYLASRYSTKHFADITLRLPLMQRRFLLQSRNTQRIRCQDIVTRSSFSSHFYLENVLCERKASYLSKFYRTRLLTAGELYQPEKHIKYDEHIFKVLKYALNEYSLLDQSFIISHRLFGEAAGPLLRHQSQLPDYKDSTGRCPILTWLSVDVTSGNIDVADVQREINQLDLPAHHGVPKVVVIQACQDKRASFILPGPDFVIAEIVYGAGCRGVDLASGLTFTSVASLQTTFKYKKNVECISVSSSLARRFHSSDLDIEKTETPHVVFGESRGRSLIICNSINRDGWKEELAHAKKVFEQQLGLQLTVLLDLTAEQMIQSIKEFSHHPEHGSIMVLCIMSHGGLNGGITGSDPDSTCSIQEVVDSLCCGDLTTTPKLVFLSFCRGGLGPRTNRTSSAWECTVLPDIVRLSSYSPVRRSVDEAERERYWEERSFSSVDTPPNCYILFATLPDSKSYRGLVMKAFTEHLSSISLCHSAWQSHTASVSSEHTPDNVGSALPQHTASSRDVMLPHLAASLLPRVELVTLFTDLAAVVRERSRYTQYLHHCYTVDRQSKPVLVEILPCTDDDHSTI